MQLHISNLTKVYPNGTKALDNISLTINSGMFGLLGPNGAGKSTLLRTLATLQTPDTGQIHLDSSNIFKETMSHRKLLGYLPQEFGVYPRMSAEDLLDYLAQLKGVRNRSERKKLVAHCLKVCNLTEVRKKHVSGYSGGMKQRFGIAQILLNDPKLIIVDEPTAGLDPAERQRFLNILRGIGKDNIVIFSTHIVEDIKDLCSDMAILNHGQILQQGSPSDAIAQLDGQIYIANIHEKDLPGYEADYQVLSSQFNADNTIRIRVHSHKALINNFSYAKPTLEDFYFSTLNTYHV
jgi:ABC-type multidrug transport system ATPase subunit